MAENEKKEEKKEIVLDGKPVSQDELQEASGRKGTRLHQENETTFRTLHRFAE